MPETNSQPQSELIGDPGSWQRDFDQSHRTGQPGESAAGGHFGRDVHLYGCIGFLVATRPQHCRWLHRVRRRDDQRRSGAHDCPQHEQFQDTTLLKIAGVTATTLAGIIDHDDGISLYQGATTIVDASAPTVVASTPYVLPAGGLRAALCRRQRIAGRTAVQRLAGAGADDLRGARHGPARPWPASPPPCLTASAKNPAWAAPPGAARIFRSDILGHDPLRRA